MSKGFYNRFEDIFILDGDAIWVDRQPLVYIYGEVQRPGVLRLERGMSLMQVLAQARASARACEA